ncbi:MAG: helix-turn-helix transcriptional regulator [Bacillota bacterium]
MLTEAMANEAGALLPGLAPGGPARPVAVARAVRELAGARRRWAGLFRDLLGMFEQFVAPGEVEVLRAELGNDPLLLFAAAAALVLARHPVGRAYLEDRVREAARARVEERLRELPGMERLKPVLYGVLYASLRREFGLERAHHVPRLGLEEALEFVGRCVLPGPDTLPAGAWALLQARVRMGLTQQQMAEQLGLTRRVYSAMERGRRDVPPGLLEQVARAYRAT